MPLPKDILQQFQPEQSNSQMTFEFQKSLWLTGELSSRLFLPVVFEKVLKSQHQIADLKVELKNIPTEKLEEFLFEQSPSTLYAFQRGQNGENPNPIDILNKRYAFLPEYNSIYSRNRLFQEDWDAWFDTLDIPELERIDLQLPTSILSHSNFAGWMPNLYPRKKEKTGTLTKKRKIYENTNNNKEAYHIYLWLLTTELIHEADKLAILPLIDLTEKKELQFDDLENFANRISPAFYFHYFTERLRGIRARQQYSLPSYLQTHENQRILLSANFIELSRDRVKILGNVLSHLADNNPQEAKNILIDKCAQASLKNHPSPLKQWEIDELEIRQAIQNRIQTIKAEKVASRKKAGETLSKIKQARRENYITEQNQRVEDLSTYVLENLNSLINPPLEETASFNLVLIPTEDNIMYDPKDRMTIYIENGVLKVRQQKGGKSEIVVTEQREKSTRTSYYSLDGAISLFESLFDPESQDTKWNLEEIQIVETE